MKYVRFIVVIFILSVVAFSIVKKPILALSTPQAVSLKSSSASTIYLPVVHSFNESEPVSVVSDDDTRDDVRFLDIASENLEVLVLDAGVSTYRYGPTRKFLHFTDQNVVMPVAFSNSGTDFDLTISIFIFDTDETEIDKWINNQYSDIYDYDAPRPTDRIDLKAQDIEITSTKVVTHEVGTYGDEYDTYNVTYTISDRVTDDLVELSGFEDAGLVHVRTKEKSLLLDINSEEVETLVVETHHDSRYLYGPTLKFFHFTEQNVVMKAYSSNYNTDFEPGLSVYIFEVDETKIDRWIKSQYETGILHPPGPIRAIHVDSLDIEITATQLMTHEFGTNGDEYDTYSIEYTVRDVPKENFFSLKDFEDEIPVRIRTTDIYRILDITSEHVETSVTDTYLDIYHYGPTEKYYHFTDQYAVLKAFFPNHTTDIEPTFTLYIFNMDEIGIDGWIENQHPESAYFWPLYPGVDLSKPTHTIDIHQSNYTITSTTLISHEVGTYGDEYDTYNIEYIFDEVVEEEIFKINGFSDKLPVHVQTEDVEDSDHLHLLDITSDDVQIVLQTNGFFGNYVSTRKFFHFTDQNILLGVYFPNYNTDFEPTISIIIFDDQVASPSIHDDKEAEIRSWIAHQQPFDTWPLTQPIHVIDISSEYYEITSTQYVEHVVGPQCGTYDKYNVSYTIHDVTDENFFELSGFQDEVPVYVEIRPHDELMPTQEPGSPARVCYNS